MLNVETRHAIDPQTAKGFDTDTLRRHFHLEGLFGAGQINLVYTHYDRMIIGGAVPAGQDLVLDKVKEAGTESILDRREMVVANIGETGTVRVGGQDYAVANGEMLYIGMGAGAVTLSGAGRFYILSAPAHKTFPTRLVTLDDAVQVDLGSQAGANARTIRQFVHPNVMPSCQLVVGMTRLAPGSVWNTMPAHTHDRRMEAYLYIDLPEDQAVVHLMGQPDETRHMIIRNEQGAISPPWSIHSGAGTAAYAFIWAMAGDNVDFTDMDMVDMGDLR